MHDAYFWIAFFGAPLFLVLMTAFVFRPSAREHYRDAKQVIFADNEPGNSGGEALAHTKEIDANSSRRYGMSA